MNLEIDTIPPINETRYTPVTELLEDLRKGAGAMGLSLSDEQYQQQLAFIGLLVKWNKAYNLTAVRKPELMITRHLLDSLVILPHIRGDRVLDVGTGPGLPGIPLAIVQPEREFTLLDSNNKKIRFVTQAVTALGLSNVNVVQSRVEEYEDPRPFDTIMARAFSTVRELAERSEHLLAEDGVILAMKGVYPLAEIDELPDTYQLEACHKLTVPDLDAERHLLVIKRA